MPVDATFSPGKRPGDIIVKMPDRQEIEAPPPAQWPTLHSAALHGLAGDAVRLVCADSEADPAAVLGQFLVRFGATLGPGPHVRVSDDTHYVRLFAVIVGETSRARKGTAGKPVDRFFKHAEQAGSLSPLPVCRLYPNLSKVNVARSATLAVSDAAAKVYGIC